MKIIHIAEELGIGGLPNYILQLARLSSAAGHSVDVVFLGKINEDLETAGVNVHKICDVSKIAALNPDILHVHLLSDVSAIENIISLNVPRVRSFHDYTSTCLRRGKRRWPGDRCQRPLNIGCAAYGCMVAPPTKGFLPRLENLPAKITERDLYLRFDAAIAGSAHMGNMLRRNGFSLDKTYVIPYFSRFAGRPLSVRIRQEKPMRFLFSGQAVKGKGLEILIEALAGVEGAWELAVFSEGPRLGAARELTERLGLSEKISFQGWISHSQLEKVYTCADALILPSIWDDPGPLVGIEAMSFSVPVVAFAVGGIPDYVRDNETGYLVQDIKLRGLRKALQSCLNHPEKLSVMGAAGHALVHENHTPEIHMARLNEVYNHVLSNWQEKSLKKTRKTA